MNKKFTCPICGEIFTSLADFYEHIDEHKADETDNVSKDVKEEADFQIECFKDSFDEFCGDIIRFNEEFGEYGYDVRIKAVDGADSTIATLVIQMPEDDNDNDEDDEDDTKDEMGLIHNHIDKFPSFHDAPSSFADFLRNTDFVKKTEPIEKCKNCKCKNKSETKAKSKMDSSLGLFDEAFADCKDILVGKSTEEALKDGSVDAVDEKLQKLAAANGVDPSDEDAYSEYLHNIILGGLARLFEDL